MAVNFSNTEIENFCKILGDKKIASELVDFKKNFKNSSKDEITFIVYVLSVFKPLQFDCDKKMFHGVLSEKFKVLIKLQSKVQNPKTKKYWSIDATIEVMDLANHSICKIGLEYDGHDSHFIESKVKKQNVRDLTIAEVEGIFCFRVNPDMVKTLNDKKNIARSIKNILIRYTSGFFKYFKVMHEEFKVNNECLTTSSTSFVKNIGAFECPLCEGFTKLGNDFCIECGGTGFASIPLKVSKNEYSELEFDCPECPSPKHPYKQCKICKGNGVIDRIAAISYEKNK